MWELVTKSVASSSPLEQSVLYLLILFSIVSWAIIFMKIKAIARAKKNNDAFMKIFDDARSVQNVSAPATDGPAPISAVYKAGMEAASQARILAVSHPDDYFDKIQQRMAHTCKTEFNTIRWGLGFLASVASASPFIGLFGTVWGIMSTFQNLGDGAFLAARSPGAHPHISGPFRRQRQPRAFQRARSCSRGVRRRGCFHCARPGQRVR
jgi:biopolymer transport protein TolQ